MAITQLNTTNGTGDAVRYAVIKNHAASQLKGENIFNARVITTTKSLQAVADTMVREGSKYQAYEIVGILTQFADVVSRLVSEGYAVNVGSLMKIRPSIQGKFDAEDDNYDEGKQRILVKTTAGTLLRNVAASANVRRIDGKTTPVILSVVNVKTGNNDTISSEGYIFVKGKYMIWDGAADAEGFFIIVDGEEHKLVPETHTKDEALLVTDATLTPGKSVDLVFRTAKDGSLVQETYDTGLTAE